MLAGKNKTVRDDFVDRFLLASARTPAACAIDFDGNRISYAALRLQVLALAAMLQKASADHAVLLLLPRGVELIAAAIACQYAGIPYLPVDFSIPAARLLQVLRHQPDLTVLTTASAWPESQPARLPDGIRVLDCMACLSASTSRPAVRAHTPETCRIQTSGSTGVPKMVCISGEACSNVLDFFADLLGGGAITCLSCTSPGFDIFYLEYTLPLASGGRLILLSERQAGSPQEIARLLLQHRPRLFQSTPSLLKCLLPYLGTGQCVDQLLLGGEPLGAGLSARAQEIAGWACNVYGPTETTVWSCYQPLRHPGETRIGRPVQNTQICLLDETGAEVPQGRPGNIHIAGAGLALGYLANPALTGQKFSRSPTGILRYDTGDIGLIDEDGVLNFLGRDGDFVKINGHRVDPLEIAEAIEQLSIVKQAAVLPMHDTDGDVDYLAVFITCTAVATDPEVEVRQHLADRLPGHMQPRWIRVVPQLPRTCSGKLDQQTLRAMVVPAAPASPATPTDPRLAHLLGLLGNYLAVDRLDVQDNLFSKGLSSMHAVSLHVALAAGYPWLELFHLFEWPTLAGLMDLITREEDRVAMDATRFPHLQTARLQLRELCLADAPALLQLEGDADTMKWYGVDPLRDQQGAIDRLAMPACVRPRYRAYAGVLSARARASNYWEVAACSSGIDTIMWRRPALPCGGISMDRAICARACESCWRGALPAWA